jgi:hypothetical protein
MEKKISKALLEDMNFKKLDRLFTLAARDHYAGRHLNEQDRIDSALIKAEWLKRLERLARSG